MNDIEDIDITGFPAAENSESIQNQSTKVSCSLLFVEMWAFATMCTIDDCIAGFHQLERKAEGFPCMSKTAKVFALQLKHELKVVTENHHPVPGATSIRSPTEEEHGMWNIKKSVYIDRPVDDVYHYAIDPTRWFLWYVGLGEPENLVGKGETGTTLDTKYTMLGMHMPISIEVLETGKDGDRYTWKGTVNGAIKSQQVWTYVPEGEGMEITIDINYELPGKLLGKVANTLIIKKLMDNSVEQTLNNLKAICETSDTYSMN